MARLALDTDDNTVTRSEAGTNRAKEMAMDETELSGRSDPEGRADGSIVTPEEEAATVLGGDPADVPEVGDDDGPSGDVPFRQAGLAGHPDNVVTSPTDVDAQADPDPHEEDVLPSEEELDEAVAGVDTDPGEPFGREEAEGVEIAVDDQPQGGGL
jgi:hypothetical protein